MRGAPGPLGYWSSSRVGSAATADASTLSSASRSTAGARGRSSPPRDRGASTPERATAASERCSRSVRARFLVRPSGPPPKLRVVERTRRLQALGVPGEARMELVWRIALHAGRLRRCSCSSPHTHRGPGTRGALRSHARAMVDVPERRREVVDSLRSTRQQPDPAVTCQPPALTAGEPMNGSGQRRRDRAFCSDGRQTPARASAAARGDRPPDRATRATPHGDAPQAVGDPPASDCGHAPPPATRGVNAIRCNEILAARPAPAGD